MASDLPWDRLYDEQTKPELQVRELESPIEFSELRQKMAAAKEGGGEHREVLQRIGALALATRTVSEDERRGVVSARLPTRTWPARDVHVVAVDTASGERTAFHRASGVDFVDAIAASCAVPGVWPPVTIGGRRYMDGRLLHGEC